MDVIGIIPARFESTRFPGKVLAEICGKPMVQWVWEAAKKTKVLDDVIVACDNDKIKQAVESFGGKAFLTSKSHPSGTDRICEIVNPIEVKVVVNLQADEPLIQPLMIEKAVRPLLEDKSVQISTLMKVIDDYHEITDPNVVKVVTDKYNYAMYFSRSVIPYQRDKAQNVSYYKHIGLYAYTKDFLFVFKNLPESGLEKIEKLEQLRVLEAGFKIKVIEIDELTIGVDTPQDLDKVKAVIRDSL